MRLASSSIVVDPHNAVDTWGGLASKLASSSLSSSSSSSSNLRRDLLGRPPSVRSSAPPPSLASGLRLRRAGSFASSLVALPSSRPSSLSLSSGYSSSVSSSSSSPSCVTGGASSSWGELPWGGRLRPDPPRVRWTPSGLARWPPSPGRGGGGRSPRRGAVRAASSSGTRLPLPLPPCRRRSWPRERDSGESGRTRSCAKPLAPSGPYFLAFSLPMWP